MISYLELDKLRKKNVTNASSKQEKHAHIQQTIAKKYLINRAKIAIFKLYNSELPKISHVNKSKTTLTSSAED